MFAYYLDLALRSLKRNRVLTTLMVLALALGIGATITTLTVLRLLSGDPLPQKSAQLFYPQIDPGSKDGYIEGQSKPDSIMSYPDAMNLLHARRGTHQAVMALTQAKIMPKQANAHPSFNDAVMTTADFFTMFDAPFQYGGGWTAADDDSRAQLVVIAGFLNDKLFDGANSVGRIIRVNDHDLRIVGVLKPWAPQPRFYAQNLGGRSYGDGDAVFLPLHTARAMEMGPQDTECYAAVPDIRHLETAPCEWLGVWVELNSSEAVASYKTFLDGYVRQQVALGRFQRTETSLLDLMGWLRQEQVVPDDVRLQAGLAFGFLLICVVNTVGLLLAKCLRRSQEIACAVRWAPPGARYSPSSWSRRASSAWREACWGCCSPSSGCWASATSRPNTPASRTWICRCSCSPLPWPWWPASSPASCQPGVPACWHPLPN